MVNKTLAQKAVSDFVRHGGVATALGYMFYAAWDSMERSRYLAAYQGAGEVPILWSPAFLIVALLCALGAFLAQKGLLTSVDVKPLRFIVPFVASLSSIVLCLQRLASISPNPALVVTFGLCIAWYILAWADRLGTIGGGRTFAIMLIANGLASVFEIFCVQVMGSLALLITTALLPLATSLLLHASPGIPIKTTKKSVRKPFSWSWAVIAAVGLFGTLYFMLLSLLYVHPYSYVNSIIVPAGTLCALALLLCIAACLPRWERIADLFLPGALGIVMLIFIVAIILTPFLQMNKLWGMLVVMGSHCGFCLLLIGLSEVCRRQDALPLVVFGGGFAALYAGYSVGGFIGVSLAQYGGNITSLLLGCSLLALGCIGIALWWLFKGRKGMLPWNLEKTEESEPEKPVLSFEECYDKAIEDMKQRFGLSPREAEVLSLLARGRSSTYISETLFISPNTTKKHIQHVYKKLEIHSNQEAIDMVDDLCRTD